MRNIFIIVCFFSLNLLYAQSSNQRTDSFRALIYHDHVRVTAPSQYMKEVSVILENHTLADIIGRVVTDNKTVLHYVRIPQDKTRSLPLSLMPGQRVYFESQSPPFQEVELIFSRDAYEIPPKR